MGRSLLTVRLDLERLILCLVCSLYTLNEIKILYLGPDGIGLEDVELHGIMPQAIKHVEFNFESFWEIVFRSFQRWRSVWNGK